MTDPQPLHRPIPGCHYELEPRRFCGRPGVTVDGINGRRCDQHPPQFSPDTAVELMRRGLPGTALAYVRGAA